MDLKGALCVAVALFVVAAHAGCPHGGAGARQKRTVASTHPTWMSQIPEASNASDPLVVTNNIMKDLYSQSGQQMLPKTLIFQESDYLVLLRQAANGSFLRVREDAIIPPLYHNLKMVSHISLAIFVMFLPFAQKEAPFPMNAAVEYQQSLATAVSTIDESRFSNITQLTRQHEIVSICVAYLNQAIARGSVCLNDLQAFIDNVSTIVYDNVRDAARAQVDLMIAVMADWRANVLAPEEWEGLRFVSRSSHMAVEQNVVSQVFARLLSAHPAHPDMGPNDPNMRFITLDDVTMTEDAAAGLLATHYTDYAIGTAYFGSPYRMHRDLLADVTTQYLDELFPAL